MRRGVLLLSAALVLSGFFWTAVSVAAPHGCAAANATAAVVIEHGDGSSLRYCEPLAAGESAYDLLKSTGVEIGATTFGGMGEAICQLDYEPPAYSPSNCWGDSGWSWVFFISRAGGAWQLSNYGVSSTVVNPGDAIGFRYDSNANLAVPPSPVGICSTPAPTATASVATASSMPAASHPMQPTTVTTQQTASAQIAPSAKPFPKPRAHSDAAAVHHAPLPAPLSPALLLGFMFAGGLAGLLILQLLSRRGHD